MKRDKREKFIELAEKRVSKALKNIALIGNLSNPTNYEFNSKDAQLIVSALEKEVSQLKQRFGAARRKKRVDSFKLDGETER